MALSFLAVSGCASSLGAGADGAPGAGGSQPPSPPKDDGRTSKDAAFSPHKTVSRLVILHTSDNESDLLGHPSGGAGDASWGGTARATTVIAALRARSDAPVITLAAGDTMMPAPELKLDIDGENAVARGNNMLGYHASALGNHEFDLGESFLAEYIKQVAFPYVTATLDFKAGPLDEIDMEVSELTPDNTWLVHHPGRILPRGKLCAGGELTKDASGLWRCSGLTVGIVGATTETLRAISAISENIGVANGLDGLRRTVQQHVDALVAEGVDHVVLLSHLQDANKELELVDLGLVGVDVIIAGGGDNRLADAGDRLLPNEEPDPVCSGEKSCYPILRRARDGRPVAIVATDGQMKYIGHLALSFDDEGVLTGYDMTGSRPWPVDEGSLLELRAEPVREAVAFETRLKDTLAPLMTSFAHTSVFLDGTREAVRNHETNLADLSTDAMLWGARDAFGGDVAFAFRNGGGIRAPIGAVDRKTHERLGGPIRTLDLQGSFRFDNPVVVIYTSHQVVKDTLESALRGAGTSRGHFPHLSENAFLAYSLAAPEQTHVVEGGHVVGLGCPGARVRELRLTVEGGKVLQIVKDGVVLTPKAPIGVATLQYLSKGGDAYFPGVVKSLQPKEAKKSAVEGERPSVHTEQSTLREYILALDAQGKWKDGAAYPMLDSEKPETHPRVRRLDEPLPVGANVPQGCAISVAAGH